MKTITIELPADVVPKAVADTPDAFARALRLAAAIEWYREGLISQGKGAEFAGIGRIEFIEALGRAKVDSIQITPEELEEEVERSLRADRDRKDDQDAISGAFARGEAEGHYRVLGRWKGPLAAADVQAAAREFFRSGGERGARWLVDRLRGETNVESLHAVAALLADLGPVALEPIAWELRHSPAPDQARALLQALGWMGESPEAPDVTEAAFELSLALFLQSLDADTREAAARAMRLLPPDRAAHWLGLRAAEERDADVAETVAEELARHQAARA